MSIFKKKWRLVEKPRGAKPGTYFVVQSWVWFAPWWLTEVDDEGTYSFSSVRDAMIAKNKLQNRPKDIIHTIPD